MTAPTTDILTRLNEPAGVPPDRMGQPMQITCSAWDATASRYLAVGYRVGSYLGDDPNLYPTENLVWFRRDGVSLTKLPSPALPANVAIDPSENYAGLVVTGLAWTPNGAYLAAATGGQLTLWHRDDDTLTMVSTYPLVGVSGVGGYTGSATQEAMTWDPTGTYLSVNLTNNTPSNTRLHVLKRTGDTLGYVYHYTGTGGAYGATVSQWIGTDHLHAAFTAGAVRLARAGDTFTALSFTALGSTFTGSISYTPDGQRALLAVNNDSGGGGAVYVDGQTLISLPEITQQVPWEHFWFTDWVLFDPTGTYAAAAGAEIYDSNSTSWGFGGELRSGLKWARRDGDTWTALPSPEPGTGDSWGYGMSWGGGTGGLYLVSGGVAYPGLDLPVSAPQAFGFSWYFVGSPSELSVRFKGPPRWEFVGTPDQPLRLRTTAGWQYTWPGSGVPLRVRGYGGWEEVLT